jgi:p-aminobenzoyl-glutamate transporter AbgT
MSEPTPATDAPAKRSLGTRMLDLVERVGNRLDGHRVEVPSKDGPVAKTVESQLSGSAITTCLADMVRTFTSFHPLGVTLTGRARRRTCR